MESVVAELLEASMAGDAKAMVALLALGIGALLFDRIRLAKIIKKLHADEEDLVNKRSETIRALAEVLIVWRADLAESSRLMQGLHVNMDPRRHHRIDRRDD